MEDSVIASQLNLDGASEIASKSSSYQTFLQQLNLDTNSADLYQQTQCPVKEPSISSIQVYQKNPPPYYQFQPQEAASKRHVVQLVESKPQDIVESASNFETERKFNDKLICK